MRRSKRRNLAESLPGTRRLLRPANPNAAPRRWFRDAGDYWAPRHGSCRMGHDRLVRGCDQSRHQHRHIRRHESAHINDRLLWRGELSRPDDGYLRQVISDLEPLGDITPRPYFGGVALVESGRQFAMFMGNTLYLRADSATRPDFVQQGCQPFSYRTRSGVREVRAYYSAPSDIADDPDLLVRWARRALETTSS